MLNFIQILLTKYPSEANPFEHPFINMLKRNGMDKIALVVSIHFYKQMLTKYGSEHSDLNCKQLIKENADYLLSLQAQYNLSEDDFNLIEKYLNNLRNGGFEFEGSKDEYTEGTPKDVRYEGGPRFTLNKIDSIFKEADRTDLIIPFRVSFNVEFTNYCYGLIAGCQYNPEKFSKARELMLLADAAYPTLGL